MCGICGFYQPESTELESIIASMNDTLKVRGPDSAGIWTDGSFGIALGHRRLSILDLSPEGHQPMHSKSGRFVIVFNGEIYNFSVLRAELAKIGHFFRGSSDTEVMLAAIEQWGVFEALQRFVGMFAFALWDRQERKLFLARDRLGEKPLYYGWCQKIFLFGSELKALAAHPLFRPEVNRNALALFMRHNYIPSPWSIYKGVYKLKAGTVLQLDYDDVRSGGANFTPWPESEQGGIRPRRYWSARIMCESGLNDRFDRDEEQAVEQLDITLRQAVQQQMVADVPLGAFLSGGIDSSVIVALMQAQSSIPVRTFSIGFYENQYNEAHHAREVARHLGTNHTELYVTAKDAIEVIPRLSSMYDEPFSDSSQIPTFLVSKLARQHVTVSLSGDGGDELFCGYPRFLWAKKIWNTIGWAPMFLRKPLATLLKLPGEAYWDQFFQVTGGLLPASFNFHNPGHKVHRLADVLTSSGPGALYHKLLSHCDDTSQFVYDSAEPPTVLTQPGLWPADGDFIRQMMFLDLVSYLPDDIMVKVDRASMAVSLESRAPFLDHRVVEFAWRLPLSMKVRGHQSKWILRKLLDRYVPRQLVDRPKMGFSVPIDSWLTGPLRDWAEALLDERRLKSEGFLNPMPIRRIWDEHLRGRRNWSYALWDVLMFQSWLEQSKRTP